MSASGCCAPLSLGSEIPLTSRFRLLRRFWHRPGFPRWADKWEILFYNPGTMPLDFLTGDHQTTRRKTQGSFERIQDPMSQQFKMSALSPVIVIDDDEFFRIAIDTVLRERFGVDKVVICATAADAVEQLSSGTGFGLGLVDLNMPDMENRRLLATLKAAQPDIRLVVLSASRSREDILMALSSGAQGFINKGLGIGETEFAIRQIANGAVYVPPFTPQAGVATTARESGDEPPSISLAALTPRQMEVLRLLVAGQPNKGIARTLDITPSTVKFHLSFIFRILGASNRVEAAILGAKLLEKGA